MTEAEWLAATDSGDLIAHLVTRSGLRLLSEIPRVPNGAMSKRKLSLFYCGCYRVVWSLLNTRQQEVVVLLDATAEEPEFTTDLYGYDEYFARELGGNAAVQADIFRNIFGNPFRPVTFSPEWRTDTRLPLLVRCTNAATSPRCRFWPTRCKTPDATTMTSSHCPGDGPDVRWVSKISANV